MRLDSILAILGTRRPRRGPGMGEREVIDWAGYGYVMRTVHDGMIMS